jgi:DtxR family manganese transport transcriptional regulator
MGPLMSRRSSTASYRKTRVDHASETAEDYVEAIDDLIEQEGQCRVTTLARRLGISHVTVSRTLTRLAAEGLVETQPYRPIVLTKEGHELAAWARQRHELVLNFLKALGVPDEVAIPDAEGMEHHCSPKTLSAMKRFLKETRS